MRDDWRRVRLAEVLKHDVHEVDIDPESTYPIAGVYSFGRGLFQREALPGTGTSYRVFNRLREGQLVLSKLKAWEGALGVVPSHLDGYFASQEFPTFSILEGLDSRFLGLLCSQPSFWQLLQDESRGMGGRRERVHPRRFLDIEILLPPKEEQLRIVDLVSSLDRLSELARRLTSLYKDLARRIRAEHFESLAGERMLAGEFFVVTMGRQRSPKNASGDHMVPYLRAANVKDGRLDLSDVKEMNFTPVEQARFRLQEGDVLVTEGCGSLRQLGASARWSGEIGGNVCFQNTLLRLRARTGTSRPGYAYQWARYSFESNNLARIASGTNIFHLGADRVGAMPVIRVSLDEQDSFVRTAEATDTGADSARRYSACLNALRAALLNDLLSGSTTIPQSYDRLLGAAG